MTPRRGWPDGKGFAFTIFDDTDLATVENVRPVYDFLTELGMRTTKSVWAIRGEGSPAIGGSTCDEPDYADFALDLQHRGFEIASHGATSVTATRDVVVRSLDRFRALFGHDPTSLANHSGCRDSIYWGAERVTGSHRLVYDALTRFSRRRMFRGHVQGDPLFWGDLCRQRVRYVRNFTFADIDTLAACPVMPYHDPERPFVNSWFAASEGADVAAFTRCIAEPSQDRLERGGGACIMYTHLASGFFRRGRLDPTFVTLMRRLAARNGWFVPVATLLDFLSRRKDQVAITADQRRALERRWLRSKLTVGST